MCHAGPDPEHVPTDGLRVVRLCACRGYAATLPSADCFGSPSPATAAGMAPVPATAVPVREATSWARPRGSLAARKMALSHTASAATGTTAMMASCHAERAEFGFMGLLSFRVGEAVAHRYDPFDWPDLGQDVPTLLNGLGAAFEGHDAVLHRDGEAAQEYGGRA